LTPPKAAASPLASCCRLAYDPVDRIPSGTLLSFPLIITAHDASMSNILQLVFKKTRRKIRRRRRRRSSSLDEEQQVVVVVEEEE
jgi:hypothetical protein